MMNDRLSVYPVTATGFYHEYDSVPNQDAIKCFTVPGEIIGMICADGCSSTVWSGIASAELVGYISQLFSTSAFIKQMESYLSDNAVKKLSSDTALFDPRYSKVLHTMVCDSIQQFISEITEKFKFIRKLYSENAQAQDFAATMTLIFVQPCSGMVTSLSIGDSFAVAKLDNDLIYIDEPKNGDSPAKTFFITDKHLRKHLTLKQINLRSFDYLLVSTDGLMKLHRNFDDFLSQIHISPQITPDAVKDMFLGNRRLPDDIGFLLAVNDDKEY